MEESFLRKHLEYVFMPWDDKKPVTVSQVTYNSQSRWDFIKERITHSKISNVDDLVSVFKSYNGVFDKKGQREEPSWKCPVLYQYFAQIDESEKKIFFEENGVLTTMKNMTLGLESLLPDIKLLKSGSSDFLKFHKHEIASILCGAFFCIFPKTKADCPSINFNTLYEGSGGSVSKYYIEKVKCLMHYFKRIHTEFPVGIVTFYRLFTPDNKFPRWDETPESLCSLKVDVNGKIEDQQEFLQMDFANRYVGGGVLGRGCVQEEIRFLISPELIAARLFTEALADNESMLVVGAERFCNYTGYSNTFAFAGDYKDTTPYDEYNHRKTYLIMLDALHFYRPPDQYRESKILRELKKAHVGFSTQGRYKSLPLATGNWGCGAFGGDPQLKFILQLMAASKVGRNILYLTFGNTVLKNQIEEFYNAVKTKNVTVCELYRIIRLYNRERNKNQTVFEFVLAAIRRSEGKFSKERGPSTSRVVFSAFGFSTSNKSPKPKPKIDSLEEETNFFPDMEMDFEALDRDVHNQSRNFATERKSACTESCSSSDRPREISSILDVIWSDDSSKCAIGQTEEFCDVKTHTVRGNSPSLFSDEEMEVDEEKISEKNPSSVKDENLFPGSSQNSQIKNKSGNAIPSQVRRKKVVQQKITNFF